MKNHAEINKNILNIKTNEISGKKNVKTIIVFTTINALIHKETPFFCNLHLY